MGFARPEASRTTATNTFTACFGETSLNWCLESIGRHWKISRQTTDLPHGCIKLVIHWLHMMKTTSSSLKKCVILALDWGRNCIKHSLAPQEDISKTTSWCAFQFQRKTIVQISLASERAKLLLRKSANTTGSKSKLRRLRSIWINHRTSSESKPRKPGNCSNNSLLQQQSGPPSATLDSTPTRLVLQIVIRWLIRHKSKFAGIIRRMTKLTYSCQFARRRSNLEALAPISNWYKRVGRGTRPRNTVI